MLSTRNLSAAQAETYYTKEDYYSKEEKAHPTKWVGKGAAVLGLSGVVNQQDFSNLLAGKSPDGQSLTGRTVDLEKRRAGTDFTFSAPKSVSIAALVQRDERVLAAHHQAVNKALSVLEERYAQTRVSTPTGRQKITTGNLAAAAFTHATSREAEPQLHSHCVVMNATQLPDGRWFSFSNEAAIANQKLLGQIYQNKLALALKQHGYEIEPKAHGQFELKGYSPELLKAFSTRRQQILKQIQDWEATGAKNNRFLRETATLMSRKRKPKEVDEGLLQRGWNALIQLKGLEPPELPEDQPQLTKVSASAQSVIDSAIQHCGERESVFRRTKLERFVFEHQLEGQSFDQVEDAIATHPKLIQVEAGKFTTQVSLNPELNTIRLMQQGRGAIEPIALTTTDYLNLPAEERAKTLVLTGTNQERLELTQRIRAGLQAEGALEADSFTLKGLHRKDLTTAQASYASAYAPGDVLVPIQDYRKQELLRGEQYTVLTVDKDSQRLELETPNGSVMSVDPVLCPRKTVYATQAIPIAVGDKLRWTRNNPKTGVRNGQTFVMKQIKADGKAEIVDTEGQTRHISLNGKQYVDYAWVSTTYSSQGKTANRVLALLGETTHREAFYVAISRAKYGLTLYTANQEELTGLAQLSRAKENVSDYAPLFEKVVEYEQQFQNPNPVSNIDYRAVGERIGKRIAEQLAAVESGNSGEHRTSHPLGAGRAGFEQGFEELAAALEPYLEPLARSIAGYRDQRDPLRCAGDLANAATAVNRGLEQSEQLAENRAASRLLSTKCSSYFCVVP